ncbi:OLC1v1004985C1 [Oldenlandia corymbosa var. corymbosa]|uniref:OLC1v1004985C1 n=1 Tax=Oldenlandia corymbosa var. corymbosa TaxID=529605 RepID=A0AAV1DEC4_OLDCO|nr:OLC1v1004985C1 [Oldenlandia corymbosa var. corymbosa]
MESPNKNKDLLNIDSGNSDNFYRYKMPKMITKIEGRGNGIKTNIVNMVDIAKALARPPSYPTKYFGTQLGAISKFIEKTGTSQVNGSHETAKLAGLLEVFIKKYVQCYYCKNPETDIIVTKSQMVQLQCKACGNISYVDMRDKLTTFILKNPPKAEKGSFRRAEQERLNEGESADLEQKKMKKDSKKKMVPSSNDDDHGSSSRGRMNDEDDDDDVEWQIDTSSKAAKLTIKEQLNTVTADMVMLTTDEGTDRKSKAADNNKPRGGRQKATSPEKILQDVKAILKKGVASADQLKSALASVSGSPQEVMSALFEALLDGVKKVFRKEVLKKKDYFAVAVSQDENGQLLLLHAIEEFF